MNPLVGLARAIANAALLLEFSDDDQIDADLAVQALEQMASDLQALSPADQQALSEVFKNISSGYEDAAHAEFVACLGASLGLADG